ncbi:Tolloid-like protein [Schistosoma japonicum]|nr:Tolloid-like protein [Schistosoma japonicum]
MKESTEWIDKSDLTAYYGDIALDEQESQLMSSKGIALSDDPLQIWDLEVSDEMNNKQNKHSTESKSISLNDNNKSKSNQQNILFVIVRSWVRFPILSNL